MPKAERLHPLARQVLETWRRRSLAPEGARVLVAVSGGPDSTALLHALHTLRLDLALDLAAGHVEHGLRGEESLADARYVERLAGTLGVPFRMARLDLKAPEGSCDEDEGEADAAETRRPSLQMRAREARYRALAEMARDAGCGVVATAHTRDDQAETVLLRVLLGTGLEGLGGIPHQATLKSPGGGELFLIRPLLDVTRAQVESYCAERGLEPRTDSSNLSPKYLRNRVRHEVMPFLRERVNPELDGALARLAEVAREEWTALNGLEEEAWARASLPSGAETTVIQNIRRWPLERALRRRLLRRALLQAAPWHPPHFDAVERVLSHLGERRWRGEVEPGLTVEVREGVLTVSRR